jgi:hypothetical protein
MPLTSAKLFEDILLSLSVLRYIIKSRSKRGLYDLNKQSESFFANVLNLTEGWNLKNLNHATKDHPAVDLGDESSGICIQVTSENRAEKIHLTLSHLLSKNLDKKYSRLIIFILSEKKNYKSEFASTNYLNFNKKSDIWDIDDLLERIEKLSLEKLDALQQYLSKELAPVVNSLALKNSLLANAEQPIDMGLVTFSKFLKFLNYDPDDGYWDDAFVSIKNFHKILSNYSRQQREYLAFIIKRGKIEGQRWDERISMFPAELVRLLRISTHESAEYFRVLEGDNLIWYDDDEQPGKLRLTALENDVNFFVGIRQYCEEIVGDGRTLEKIIVECDFTLLD